HQFAMTVAIFSPLQFVWWYDRPAQYGGEPEFEFLERVPTVWDETRVLDGRIGEYAVIARRKGREWYVGCLTNEEPRTLSLPLGFLEPGVRYTAARFCDAPEPGAITDVHIAREGVTADAVLEVAMRARGGQAIILSAEKRDAETQR
ncbi:MAG: alpha-glucosidase, partial [Chloroflexi bacterium]|nr:alpha-glucosidase [Chloroflexota bacterium]